MRGFVEIIHMEIRSRKTVEYGKCRREVCFRHFGVNIFVATSSPPISICWQETTVQPL